jgi:hypothetical protein
LSTEFGTVVFFFLKKEAKALPFYIDIVGANMGRPRPKGKKDHI